MSTMTRPATVGTPAPGLSGASLDLRLAACADFARVGIMISAVSDDEMLSDASVRLLGGLAELTRAVAEGLLARDAASEYEADGLLAPPPVTLPAADCELLAHRCDALLRAAQGASHGPISSS